MFRNIDTVNLPDKFKTINSVYSFKRKMATKYAFCFFLDLLRKNRNYTYTRFESVKIADFLRYTERLCQENRRIQIWSEWFFLYTVSMIEVLLSAKSRYHLNQIDNDSQEYFETVEMFVKVIEQLKVLHTNNPEIISDFPTVLNKMDNLLETISKVKSEFPVYLFKIIKADLCDIKDYTKSVLDNRSSIFEKRLEDSLCSLAKKLSFKDSVAFSEMVKDI